MKRRRGFVDADGVAIRAGARVIFSYGIPPVVVRAEVIDRDGELIVLTPGHSPAEEKLSRVLSWFDVYVDTKP